MTPTKKDHDRARAALNRFAEKQANPNSRWFKFDPRAVHPVGSKEQYIAMQITALDIIASTWAFNDKTEYTKYDLMRAIISLDLA